MHLQVGGLPRGITPPEVLQLFWGWQAKVTGTYVDPAGSGPHVEVRTVHRLAKAARLQPSMHCAWHTLRITAQPRQNVCPVF